MPQPEFALLSRIAHIGVDTYGRDQPVVAVMVFADGAGACYPTAPPTSVPTTPGSSR